MPELIAPTTRLHRSFVAGLPLVEPPVTLPLVEPPEPFRWSSRRSR